MEEPDPELLVAVFRFRTQRPSATQTESFCWRLRDALAASVHAIGSRDDGDGDASVEGPRHDGRRSPLDTFTSQERAWLRRGWKQLESEPPHTAVGDVWTVQWFPAYGGVLQAERVDLHTVMLRVVALDKWAWTRHFLPTGECVDSAVPEDHVAFSCGRLASAELDDFHANCHEAMGAAAQITGSARSAASASGTMGHQRTPQFLVATVRNVLAAMKGEKCELQRPRGGMTDVGLHTGGAARDTCWPLVCAALRQALPKHSALFDKVMFAFHARLIERELPLDGRRSFEESSVGSFWRTIDQCFEMVEHVVDRATQLHSDGYDANGILSKCKTWRQRIDATVAHWSQAQADKYTFQPQDTLTAMVEYPRLPAPQLEPFESWESNGADGYPPFINSGTGQIVLPDEEPASAIDLLVFLESIEPHESTKILFGARLIEKFLFKHASSLTGAVSRDFLLHHAPEPLLDMMAWYQEHAASARLDGDDGRRVEQQSIYVILSWIAFCLAHRYCCDAFPDIQSYKIALDWRRLEICVVRELRCRTALGHVAKYISDWNTQVKGDALFDLSNQEGTLALARRMGQTLPVYQDLYLEVVSRLRIVCESQWAAIAARKKNLELVRQELRSYHMSLNDIKLNLQAAHEALRWEWLRQHPRGKPPRYLSNMHTQVLSGEMNRLTELVRQKTAFRDELIQLPEFVVSPLPQNEEEALQILFLVAPPRPIDILAELCWRARRSLTPPSSGVIEEAPSDACWYTHLEGIVGEISTLERAQYFSVFPTPFEYPQEFGPMSIDDVSSAEAFAYSCVWFPSGLGTAVFWSEEGEWVNPFQSDVAGSMKLFTPQLASETSTNTNEDGLERWHWVLSYPGDNGPERGNVTYAQLRMRADCDGKGHVSTAYSSLGAIRSYPFQQLRRVFACVAADSLEWSDEVTKTVLKQALYQVGAIHVSDTVPHSTAAFLWHQDLVDAVCVQQFTVALAHLIDKIKLSPRRWDCIPIISDIAAFLYQFNKKVMSLLLVLARVARCWAEEIRGEWQSTSVSDQERREMRSRECTLYGYAALCLDHYVDEEATEDEIVELCEVLVSFNHAKRFVLDDNSFRAQSQVSRIDCMMANRAVSVVKTVNSSPRKLVILNDLARIALSKIPDQVEWRQIQDRRNRGVSCCFIGVDAASGLTFVINLLSGSVTSNGGHPMSLPPLIRSLPLYQEMFDGGECEVIYSSRGFYETTEHSSASCRYRYQATGAVSDLSVEEVTSDYTLQLCTQEWIDELSQALPTRLGELYSAWYWKERRAVLLRGRKISHSGVFYVMRFDVDGTTRCYEVPRHDRMLNYATLMKRIQDYPVLIVGDPEMLGILGKFEDPRYIHILRQPKPPNLLEISLPRFGLRFVRRSDGCLASVTHRGFVLGKSQQLRGQMPRFCQYILLEKPDSFTENRRLLVPTGSVRVNEHGRVEVEIPQHSSATISFLSIDWHSRLGVFSTETIEERLQLAAIYAASNNRVPWTDLRMTGSEAALHLLRGCSPSRPFTHTAAEHLVDIATRFAYQTPVLAIMVGMLLEQSKRLVFLFDQQQHEHPVIDCTDALDEYRLHLGRPRKATRVPIRQRLSRTELWDLLGSGEAADLLHSSSAIEEYSRIETDEASDDVIGSFVERVEMELGSLCRDPGSVVMTTSETVVPRFPLAIHGSNTMSVTMLEDLHTSWSSFHLHRTHTGTTISRDAVRTCAFQLLNSVHDEYERVKERLDQALNPSPGSVQDQFAHIIGRRMDLTLLDVMRSVVEEEFLYQVLPFVVDHDRKQWKGMCIGLLELCVLEDKLKRVLSADTESEILEELHTTSRCWKPREHPYWLVFEVEGALQIRHEQYAIAKHLMENPGSICQLNMGRGKTRVILPMLFLYFSYTERSKQYGGRLVRAHFLSPLLSETRELMWSTLTSSVLRLPILELPFNRSHTLTLQDASTIRHVLTEAKRRGAVVMVAPEHRLSLELERVELLNLCDGEDMEPVVDELDVILNPESFIDVFDESDALLHHGYHLIYAVGTSTALDGGATRWLSAEALLRVLANEKSKRVRQTLQRFPDAWGIQAEYQERFGAGSGGGIYSGFRLHDASSAEMGGGKMRAELRTALVEDLIDRPPFELEWLRLFSSNAGGLRASLVRILTDPSIDAKKAMQQMPPGILHVKDQVLALRGLLAFCVLETCLQKRYRVEYGHPLARRKAIAIPFQAADLPAERSEFSHPDVGIVLTLLAFYHSGLSDEQVRRAFEVLLSLDESESKRYYNEWYVSMSSQIQDPEQRDMLASVDNISTDNAHQFAILCATYRFGMEVVNFYVNFCVFPRDTCQYPQRLSRSAWDLVRGARNIGFSGTKDTHYLLPHGVVQREPDEPSLRGTDGKMIQLLLEAASGYEPLSGPEQTLGSLQKQPQPSATACWQSVLLLAIRKHSHALIDTGALLAGVSNHEAARFLVAQPNFAFQGVTYYDTRPQFDAWVVLETDRDLLHLHHSSSLRESDTFVIFDEARARGSDMKLSPRATALLTLGPSITKDKLMQGAGRMRLLGRNQQTLWITSTRDVFKSIALQAGQSPKICPCVPIATVLSWVVDNTQRQCTTGLLEWAQSGIQFYAKKADPAYELEDDDWTLEGQYSDAQSQQLIADIIKAKLSKTAQVLSNREVDGLHAISQIESHAERFGRQDSVFVSSFDEECEREIQIEEEQQQTGSSVHHQVEPCVEQPWNWHALLDVGSVDALRSHYQLGIDIVSLKDAVRMWSPTLEFSQSSWEATKIYATSNFWSTVVLVKDDADGSVEDKISGWTSCLRDVHAMVVFADASVLLLSEYEESAVLEMLYSHAARASSRDVATDRCSSSTPRPKACFGLVHLPFVVDLLDRMEPSSATALRIPLHDVPLAIGWNKDRVEVARRLTIPFLAIAACCLLNGDTELFMARHPSVSEAAMRTLLARVDHREQALRSFITERGLASRWKRSSLHALTRRLDLEAAMCF